MKSSRPKIIFAQLDRMWVEELVALIPARLRPLALELLKKAPKASPRRPQGRPVKWTNGRRTQLRHEYQALKESGMRREARLALLGQIHRVGPDEIEDRLTPKKARRKSI